MSTPRSSRAQRLPLIPICNAFGFGVRRDTAVDAFDGRSLAMQEDAKALPRAPAARPQRYSVNLYDCAGQNGSWLATSFAEAFAVYQQNRARFPGMQVRVFNLDRCDYNTDGLTEDEAEALNDAVSP